MGTKSGRIYDTDTIDAWLWICYELFEKIAINPSTVSSLWLVSNTWATKKLGCLIYLADSTVEAKGFCFFHSSVRTWLMGSTLFFSLPAWVASSQPFISRVIKEFITRFFPVTLFKDFKWPFQGWKRDLHLGYQKVTWKKLAFHVSCFRHGSSCYFLLLEVVGGGGSSSHLSMSWTKLCLSRVVHRSLPKHPLQ